jgi:hybrid cluster-associated redox disulfide protein
VREVPGLQDRRLPNARSTVAQVLRDWPETLAVFRRHHMTCVGCALARFCTLAYATQAYHLDTASFLGELEEARRGHRADKETKGT